MCFLAFYILHFCGACTLTSVQSNQDEFKISVSFSESQFVKNVNIFFIKERGCPAAALRVWPWRTGQEKTPIELCGDTLDTYKEIISETNILQLSFYLADKAVGAKGFKATWTEIKVKYTILISHF